MYINYMSKNIKNYNIKDILTMNDERTYICDNQKVN